MRLRHGRIERKRAVRLAPGPLPPLGDLRALRKTEVHVGARHGQAGMSQRVVAVERQRLLEGRDRGPGAGL